MNTINDIPDLKQVPSCVWAEHKYDVALIKGADPVVIIPKSSYRPCQNRYPLKKVSMQPERTSGGLNLQNKRTCVKHIVPCVKTMVTSLIKSMIGQYVQLPDTHQSWTFPFQDDEMVQNV